MDRRGPGIVFSWSYNGASLARVARNSVALVVGRSREINSGTGVKRDIRRGTISSSVTKERLVRAVTRVQFRRSPLFRARGGVQSSVARDDLSNVNRLRTSVECRAGTQEALRRNRIIDSVELATKGATRDALRVNERLGETEGTSLAPKLRGDFGLPTAGSSETGKGARASRPSRQ